MRSNSVCLFWRRLIDASWSSAERASWFIEITRFSSRTPKQKIKIFVRVAGKQLSERFCSSFNFYTRRRTMTICFFYPSSSVRYFCGLFYAFRTKYIKLFTKIYYFQLFINFFVISKIYIFTSLRFRPGSV